MPGRVARIAAVLMSSPAISRIRSFIRDLRRCQASPPSRSRVDALAVAAVARQQLDILDRDVELVAAAHIRARRNRAAPCRPGSRSAPRSGRCRGRRGRRGRPARASPARRGRRRRPCACLRRRTSRSPSMSCSVRTATSARGEAVIERQDEQRRLGLATERLLPAVDELRASSGRDPRAGRRAVRGRRGVACEHDLVAALAQLARHASATAS